ncbi:MAG TPA: energy transducer TonB [Sphingomicrobium sp.]|jgi:TonB family protein|nr:energy transducer TonB [Sphingomicrobium sp.]
MVPLLVLASITPMLWQMGSGAPAANDQMVQDARNGEFIWKYYPQGAYKRGEQGRVGFKLTVEPTGTISACDVTESSGFKALDAETCEIMGLYARVQPVRNADGRAIRATTTGFINWKLPPGATRIADASSKKTMPKPDGLICRKDVTTGSLIATTRQCMKRSEWDRQQRQTQDSFGQLQGKDTIMQGN